MPKVCRYAASARSMPHEAGIVRRMFNDYAAGKSPQAIAKQLNKENVPGPSGTGWGPSTIHGNPDRGTGILNNELYIGKLVWNRLRYIKDPETGKRVSRPNPESAWITQEVPELRIIADDLWQAVKARQKSLRSTRTGKKAPGYWDRRRPRHLFSGLMRCGCCGGGFANLSSERIGCAKARYKGTCDNRHTIRRDVLDAAVLEGLQSHLMDPALCDLNSVRNTRGRRTGFIMRTMPIAKATAVPSRRSSGNSTGSCRRSWTACPPAASRTR